MHKHLIILEPMFTKNECIFLRHKYTTDLNKSLEISVKFYYFKLIE